MKVAVLGAGMAGLSISRKLRQAGLDVQIFEKARGPSGRMSTRRTDSGQFDHGAQYMTARDDRFRAQIEEWQSRGIVSEWDASVVRLAGGQCDADSGDCTRFVGTPRMSMIARDLAGECAIELGVRIEEVTRRSGKWLLATDAGFEYPDFDVLIVAVPSPQAIPFLAEVPAFRAKASAVRMLPCHAAMVTFAEAFSPGFDAAFIDEAPLSWVARNSSKPKREDTPCWVLHSDARWSARNVDLESEKVASALIGGFAAALGAPIPDVAFRSTHRWLYARPENPLDDGALWDADLRIGVCGDWLRGDRIEDAFISAETLAVEVLGAVHSNSSFS